MPFSEAVARIAKRFGLRAVVARSVATRVSIDDDDVTLTQALADIVPPSLRFRVAGDAVVISGAPSVAQSTPAPAADEAEPIVLKPRVLSPERAAQLVTEMFPKSRVRTDDRTGSVVVFAPKKNADSIRSTFDALDAKGPSLTSSQAFPIHTVDPQKLAATLRRIYPSAHIDVGPNRTLVAVANAQQLAEMQTIVGNIDVAAPVASTAPRTDDSVAIGAARPADVARAVGAVVPGVRAQVSGQSVVFSGSQDAVAQAKALAAQLDLPAPTVRYTEVYRMKSVDASSVAALITKTLPNVGVSVDRDLNAFSALATTGEQQRIAEAVAQLDTGPSMRSSGTYNGLSGPGGIPVSQPGTQGGIITSANGSVAEVITLRAAAPGLAQGGASTTSGDLAASVQAALQQAAPDLHITVVPNNPSQLILTGSEPSITLAKQVIAQLDVAQKLVVLDTEILEVDESVAKNLGFSLGDNPVLSTVYTEVLPSIATNGSGVTPPLQGLQALARTPFTFTAQLNLLISNGNARILANPRISTISGRTATIRAGENIAILTTTGGSTGTVATTQLQTFQTGVALDITPVINAENFITVMLHPVVNSLSGTTNGVPQISTRDTETTVAMKADQTLVIGGLIEDSTIRNETKIPLLGDLPLVGKAFRDTTINKQRNELIITVTPHILEPGQVNNLPPQSSALGMPTPQPLPTIEPETALPTASPHRPRSRRAAALQAVPAPAPTYAQALGTQPQVIVPLGREAPAAVPTPAPFATPAPVGAAGLPGALGQSSGIGQVPGPTQGAQPQIGATPGIATPANLFAGPTPAPTPSAFANANTFTYGASPTNNFAAPSAAIQIYYVTLTPTVLKNNTQVAISVITSSNAQKVSIGYQGGSATQLTNVGSGQWQAQYPFSTLGAPAAQSQVNLTLAATKADGTTATMNIPVSIAQ